MASSLETVLAALSQSSLERENGASSFILLHPVWNAPEFHGGKSPASELSLQRIGFSGEDLELRTREEEKLIRALKSSSENDGMKVLQAHLETLPDSRLQPLYDVCIPSLITETVMENKSLRVSLRSKCRALSRKLVTEILRWSARVKFWEPVFALAEAGCISANEYPELVDEVVELGDVPLISLFVLRVPDLRPSHWQQILSLFLSHPAGARGSFQSMKKIWRSFITTYIERTAEEMKKFDASKVAMQRAGSIKLASAYDSFSSHELGLHLFVAAKHDEGVLGAILGELESSEVLIFLRFLNKWLEKYSSRLIHTGEVKLEERKLVPSLAQVLCCLGALLEGRYSNLVLDQSVSQELASTRGLVNSLVAVGRRAGALEGVVEHLISKKELPWNELGTEATEHIIEYMELI